VAAHVVGDRIHHLTDLVLSGDIPAARKVHEELSPLFNALFITTNPIPVKTALDVLGLPAGPPRLPLVPATRDERTRIEKALSDAGLL
jgi:4-hydroxy-tetrahydrodipicolinate synthase